MKAIIFFGSKVLGSWTPALGSPYDEIVKLKVGDVVIIGGVPYLVTSWNLNITDKVKAYYVTK